MPLVQTLYNGAPVALGTVHVEMGHKSLLMVTRVYAGGGRPDPGARSSNTAGRTSGCLASLVRQILRDRFGEIVGTGEARPTLRAVG